LGKKKGLGERGRKNLVSNFEIGVFKVDLDLWEVSVVKDKERLRIILILHGRRE
jgi:hypothetical protein